MDFLIALVAIVILLFSFVILRGAPYLPTLKRQIEDALDLLELKEGQTLLELGSGDGRFLYVAAKRGVYSVGYELNPLLVIWTRLRYFRYRKFISVTWGDYWKTDWPESDGMYVFLLQKYMKKLDTKIVQYLSQPNTICEQHKNYKVVSFGFTIPDRKPIKTKKGLSLYNYK